MDMLIEQFKILIDRPEKVKKLREYILQLAVRGKLVEQDEKDEPAAVLLERIREEKERLAKEGKIKKEKPLPEIREEEKLYELPKGWEWIRLKDSGYNLGQKKPDKTFSYIDVGSINKELGILGDEINVLEPEEAPSRARKLVQLGTVIYSTVRPYLLNIAIIDREFEYEPVVSTAFAIIHPYSYICNKFVFYYLRSIPFIEYVERQMVGMAYPAINDEKFFSGIMPLPPLDEQKRIIKKVDSLMSFCNNLEKQLERKVKYSSLSSKSAFNSIGNCSSAEELEKTLRFIIENFRDLTLGDGAVKEFKNAILQLAVQGKLVPQDPTDEPATVLLERIKEEKFLAKIRDDEKPYGLPKGWEWAKLGDITKIVRGSSPRPKGSPLYWSEGRTEYHWITIADITNKSINNVLTDTSEFLTFEGSKLSRHVKKGEIIIAVSGSTVGKSAVLGIDGYIYDGLAALKDIFDNNFRDYLYTFLLSWRNKINAQSEGSAFPNINTDKLNNIVIAIPPLQEQNRIVERVTSLMSLCNELEKRIQKFQNYNERLLEALLKEAFKA